MLRLSLGSLSPHLCQALHPSASKMAEHTHQSLSSTTREGACSSWMFSEFTIPEPWGSTCYSAIHRTMAFHRAHQALAQIFDGVQTVYSATEMSDYESMDKLQLSSDVSKEAEKDAENWLLQVEQMVRDAEINVTSAGAALQFLQSEVDKAHKAGALVHGFIKPVIRSLLRTYLSHCKHVGCYLREGSFWQIHRPSRPATENVQDWGEEYIFGGQLAPSQDRAKVRQHSCISWLKPGILAHTYRYAYVPSYSVSSRYVVTVFGASKTCPFAIQLHYRLGTRNCKMIRSSSNTCTGIRRENV